jgi:hypothetical protein
MDGFLLYFWAAWEWAKSALALIGILGVSVTAVVGAACPSSNDLRLFGLWKNGVSGSVCWLI